MAITVLSRITIGLHVKRDLLGWLPFLLLMCVPSPVWSSDFLSDYDVECRLFINDRFHLFDNFYDSGKNKFTSDKNYHVTYINPYISASINSNIRAILEIESEFILDLDSQDFDEDTEFRNAYIQCMIPSWNWTSFSIGRQALRTVYGLIYDYQAPAVKAYLDMERRFDVPVRIQTFIAEVSGHSPYFHAELKYNVSFLESVTFHYDWYSDKNDGIARIFNNLQNQRVYTSKGHIQWFGLSFEKFVKNLLVKSTFMYERGALKLRQKGQGEKNTRAEGYLFNLTCDYSFCKKLLGSFFLYLSSGDKNPENGTFTSFVSIDPYIDKTNIFFNGGFDRQFSSHNVGLNGIQLNGVIAPGLTFYYHPTPKATLKAVFAYFFTHKANGNEGDAYGWETDFSGFYNVNEHWQLIMEVNFFKPGEYFKSLTDHKDSPATEIIAGVSYYF